jgi:inhibitor of Bruton tyrosine kinase
VWRRIKRLKIKDTLPTGSGTYRPKDYKFSRVPGLCGIVAVRASAYGAYVAVRRDSALTRTGIVPSPPTLSKDLISLCPFTSLISNEDRQALRIAMTNMQQYHQWLEGLRSRMLSSNYSNHNMANSLQSLQISNDAWSSAYDMRISVSSSPARIPMHEFMLAGRSRVLRQSFAVFRKTGSSVVQDLFTITRESDGKLHLAFESVDFHTLVNLATYIYADMVVDFRRFITQVGPSAPLFKQIRTELMRLALRLELRDLEQAVRQMIKPSSALYDF